MNYFDHNDNRKVIKWAKTSLLEKKNSYKIVQKWKKIFPDHGVRRKVVDNVGNCLNMPFLPELMTHS